MYKILIDIVQKSVLFLLSPPLSAKPQICLIDCSKNQIYFLSLSLSAKPQICQIKKILINYTHTSLNIGHRSNTDFTKWEPSL